jgi:hypothetical protein
MYLLERSRVAPGRLETSRDKISSLICHGTFGSLVNNSVELVKLGMKFSRQFPNTPNSPGPLRMMHGGPEIALGVPYQEDFCLHLVV